jgi:hypothetical protein
MSLGHVRGFFYAIVLVAAALLPPASQSPAPPGLSLPQILDKMERHNQHQAQQLKRYKAVRHYEAEYRGYGSNIMGKMEVEVTFDASSGKSFKILSQSGSKLLCDKVLKKAVDSEKEASKNPSVTALTPANYKFELIGSEILSGRQSYVLKVDPLKKSKFLYQGQIWVDGTDFAVAKIEAAPARNPSFWISTTLIRYSNAKTGDFWLPHQTHSETKVRIGGNAVLTIDYGTYKIDTDTQQGIAAN